jgi:serine/threonine-protein kinase
VKLIAAKDIDPPPDGDGQEHAPEVREAIDDDPATSWSTEIYTGGALPKPGVGLYVTAESAVAARRLEVLSDTPGFEAKVYAVAGAPATSLAGWGKPIATLRGLAKETATLRTGGRRFQSYLIWIDKLPPAGQVKLREVRVLA